MSILQSVIALLQFTTIIPLGKTAPFEAFAQRIWLYPVAGYAIGGLAAMTIYIIPAPPTISALIGICILLFLTGCNHFDGLLDLGDGLMAHGGREVRIRALTDRNIGTGGIALGMMILILAILSLGEIRNGWAALLCAEVLGKYVMAIMTIFGKPFHPGLHATLHQHTQVWFIIPTTLLLIPLLVLPVSVVTLISSLIGALIIPAVLVAVGSRLFGGVNGDVTGASGEIARSLILMIFACTASIPSTTLSVIF